MGLNDKLAPAPRWLSVISLVWYVVLWARGVGHTARLLASSPHSSVPWLPPPPAVDGGGGNGGNGSVAATAAGWRAGAPDSFGVPAAGSPEAGLRRDVLQLCALYALESGLALGGGVSTLAGWRRVDFALHHAPYASVVGAALLWPSVVGFAGAGLAADVLWAYRWTLPLTLLTSANEAATIGFGLGLSRVWDRPNRLYLLLLMLALVAAECAESGAALRSATSSRALRAVALLQLGAPLYHAFGVIPCCWKRLRSREARQAGSFNDHTGLTAPVKAA